jgi:hypothetical protein
VSRFSRNLLLSGFSGLIACGLAAAVSTWLIASCTMAPPLSHPLITLLLVVIFGCFSVAEIPLMVVAMRRLGAERPENLGFVWGLNSLYVFFAAVYGLPVLLVTGDLGWGLALCSLGIVRFVTSLAFVREPRR